MPPGHREGDLAPGRVRDESAPECHRVGLGLRLGSQDELAGGAVEGQGVVARPLGQHGHGGGQLLAGAQQPLNVGTQVIQVRTGRCGSARSPGSARLCPQGGLPTFGARQISVAPDGRLVVPHSVKLPHRFVPFIKNG
jgi:hypothetical protein